MRIKQNKSIHDIYELLEFTIGNFINGVISSEPLILVVHLAKKKKKEEKISYREV